METSAYVLSFELPGFGTVRLLVVGLEDNITALELSLGESANANLTFYDTEGKQSVPSSSNLWPYYYKALASVVESTLPYGPKPGSLPSGKPPGQGDSQGGI